jgi:hypothetical protein
VTDAKLISCPWLTAVAISFFAGNAGRGAGGRVTGLGGAGRATAETGGCTSEGIWPAVTRKSALEVAVVLRLILESVGVTCTVTGCGANTGTDGAGMAARETIFAVGPATRGNVIFGSSTTVLSRVGAREMRMTWVG